MLSKIALALFCVCLLQGSFADSEQETNGVTNFAEAVLSRSRRSCGAGECNAHCKKLGHARGVCIGTYCQCRSRRRRSADEEQIEGKVEQLSVRAEDNLPVASLDENIQSDAGVTNFAEAVLSRSRRSCGAGECNAHCKKLGHARGVCIGTYCQCRSRRRRSADEDQIEGKVEQLSVIAEDNLPVASLDENIQSDAAAIPSDVTKSRSARGTCGYDECNRFCRKLGHARGVCIGNYCQCRFRRRRSADAPQDANHA